MELLENKNTFRGITIKPADILLLAVAMIWGASYGLTKEALYFYPVLGFITIRFSLTFLLLTPFLLSELKKGKKTQCLAALPLGIILLIIFLLESFGVTYTSASNAAFLISLCVLFTPFVEWGVLKVKPDNNIFILAIFSMFGAWLLIFDVNYVFNIGDLLILSAALMRAFMVSYTKRYTLNHDLSSIALTGIQSLVVAIGAGTLFFCLYSDESTTLPSSLTFWGNTAFLVVFCTIFAFFAQNYAVKQSTPSKVSFLMGTEPVFGALFASLWLGEVLSYNAIIGGGIIVFSCFLSTQLPLLSKQTAV